MPEGRGCLISLALIGNCASCLCVATGLRQELCRPTAWWGGMPLCATPRHSLGSGTGPCQQNVGLSGQICNCSDVLQLSPSAVCVDNKRIISCSGCKLRSEAGRVSPPRPGSLCACRALPCIPAVGSEHRAGAGTWCGAQLRWGFTLRPLQWVWEIGLLLSPFWAEYSPGSLQGAGRQLE